MFAPLGVVFFCAISLAAPAAAEDNGFRCDGTDPRLFEEMREAGWVGYGETWDFFTCTEDGQDIFTAAASRRFRALRLQRPHVPMSMDIDVEFYSNVIPAVTFGSFGLVIAVAAFMALVQMRRRVPPALVDCPACSVQVPVPLDDPTSLHMFCPRCGQASFSVEKSDKGKPEVRARLLA